MKVFPNVRCREIEAHTKFEAAHPSSRRLKWSQPRVQDAWTSVAGFSWEGEFNAGMRQTILVSSPVAPWIRAASDDLSMIMTILYGLEKLNGGHVEWTRKHTLTIHVSLLPL
jgi:splicing suppressor protein 51